MILENKTLTYWEYLESRMDIEVLQHFKNAKKANIGWKTKDKYASLYDACLFVEDEIRSKAEVSLLISIISSFSSCSYDYR
ncbi:hypothetical protein M0804_013724 [Polistes exclamans]|nr:hypothetical protein M0804_013724 [Polistes exclamans]